MHFWAFFIHFWALLFLLALFILFGRKKLQKMMALKIAEDVVEGEGNILQNFFCRYLHFCVISCSVWHFHPNLIFEGE